MQKQQLIESLKQKGFSKKILNAFEKVSREDFIPSELKQRAYEDIALPIGYNQTISQPYTIAMMLELLDLKEGQKVLEVGSGCGYVLALISKIIGESGKAYGIEIIKKLADKSKKNLINYKNIEIFNKNGADGLSDYAPFNRILLSAGCEEIPKTISEQLDENGILVAPVGPRYNQSLMKIQKIKNKFIIKDKIPGFVFVPFVES